jgi:hypothetical protein
MKRLMISALASAAIFAAATAMQRSSAPTALPAGTAAMPSLQQLHAAAGSNKLPIQEFEDMSLV